MMVNGKSNDDYKAFTTTKQKLSHLVKYIFQPTSLNYILLKTSGDKLMLSLNYYLTFDIAQKYICPYKIYFNPFFIFNTFN